MKSVSGAFDDAHNFTINRPVTSTSWFRGSVWTIRTSFRAESGRVSSLREVIQMAVGAVEFAWALELDRVTAVLDERAARSNNQVA